MPASTSSGRDREADFPATNAGGRGRSFLRTIWRESDERSALTTAAAETLMRRLMNWINAGRDEGEQ